MNMVDTAATIDTRSEPFRWWFAPSWLGLDAPCVVSTWTWAVSRALEVSLPVRSMGALFLVVWFIYLSDRLVDVAGCRDWSQATGRLRFGRDLRSLFVVCLGLCCALILVELRNGLPEEVIRRAAVVALGVGLHFLAFVKPVFLPAKLPGKEIGVGVFFALGAYGCLGATTPSVPLLASIVAVVAFNCFVIAARDADSDRVNDPGGASCWWRNIDRDLLWLGIAFTAVSAVSSALAKETAFYLSVGAAFALLTVLHRHAHRLSGDAVRALADFALLTPIPIMGFLKW